MILNRKRYNLLFTSILIFVFTLTTHLSACTSFMLKTKKGLLFVHSLNQGNWKSVPGLVFINQRHVWKRGFSWQALLTADGTMEPGLVWQSKYGSVTFSPIGREFPDGGMNEKGLYIWEMSLSGTQFPDDPDKPKLFMMQWMQYVLDNFTTVEEIIESAHRMSIDGWEWHFFAGDAKGNTGIIDFLDGRPVVYTGETMPVPICCNSRYPKAMEWLGLHQGFGGDVEIKQNFKELPRFIYGAKLLKDYRGEDPVDYSFRMLDAMSRNVRWSVVFDVSGGKVHYTTSVNKAARHFSFGPEDFGRSGGPLMLNIDTGKGNVKKAFAPFNKVEEKALIKSILEFFCQDPEEKKRLLDDQSIDLDGLAENIQKKRDSGQNEFPLSLAGEWTGKAQYPSGKGYEEVDMTLSLHAKGDNLNGSVNDHVLIKGNPIRNARFEAGFLTFHIPLPEMNELVHYKLYVTGRSIKGAIDIRGDRRRAPLSLERQ